MKILLRGDLNMTELSVYGIALVPVIIGLCELLKKSGVPKKFTPVSALVLGMIFSFFYLSPDDPKRAILWGIVLGLSAVGLFSGTKNTVFENLKRNKTKEK